MPPPDDASRRRQVAIAGHRGDEEAARRGLVDPAPQVRATALGALARMGRLPISELTAALGDTAPEVRRRACDVAAALAAGAGTLTAGGGTLTGPAGGQAPAAGSVASSREPASPPTPGDDTGTAAGKGLVLAAALVAVLGDADHGVVEAACFALGEFGASAPPSATEALSRVAVDHEDPLCREAAVAALGAIGDTDGLQAILAATTDKPAIRRRAVLALAPFAGPEVDAALRRAAEDRDWQVRQAAEDLLGAGD